MYDLYNELQQKIKDLNISIKKLRETGTEYAEAERDYKITLRQEALKLRAEKGMPVTLIQQVVYGVPEVAEKRFKRDVKEAIYQANQEAINSTKLQIRVIESQLNREWNNTK
ncbi:MAG: hypothetical protein J6S85_04480 [Methanobrevibacter sp.]|nr:hypothetical protein [Methanobrevibacter sp.]MBO7712802.1 hypothetical protein [Methanobrevibacter sp.]